MRKTSPAKKRQSVRNAMQKEYQFDYSQAKPNRFAGKFLSDSVAVILEPDVAAKFKSSKTVNAALRSFLSTMSEARHEIR